MVNTGRPSRGCLTCRRRRVKCDEKRSICNQCTKLKLVCEWQDEWTSLVRPQETWAKKKVSRRVEKVQQLRDMRDSLHREGFSTPSSPDHIDTTSMKMQIDVSPEVYARNHLFNDYAFTAAPASYVFAWLRDHSSTAGCLQSVVPALGLASIAKQQHRPDLMVEANKHYGNSLVKLSQCLDDPVEAKSDATLLTAYLLGIYESISHDRRTTSSFQKHGSGQIALLRFRGREQLQTLLGRNMLLLIYHDHLMTSLLGGIEPFDDCIPWIYEAWDPSPSISGMLFTHDVSRYAWQCRKLLSAEIQPSHETLFALLRTGMHLNDMAFDMLASYKNGGLRDNKVTNFNTSSPLSKNSGEAPDQLPDYLTSRLFTSKADSGGEDSSGDENSLPWCSPTKLKEMREEVKQKFCDVDASGPGAAKAFITTNRACVSLVGRATHIHLLIVIIRVVAAIQKFPSPEPQYHDLGTWEEDWTNTIRCHAEDMLDEIPHALGELEPFVFSKGVLQRAYIVLPLLRTVLEVEQTSEESRARAREILQHIDTKYGMGIAA